MTDTIYIGPARRLSIYLCLPQTRRSARPIEDALRGRGWSSMRACVRLNTINTHPAPDALCTHGHGVSGRPPARARGAALSRAESSVGDGEGDPGIKIQILGPVRTQMPAPAAGLFMSGAWSTVLACARTVCMWAGGVHPENE